MSGLRLLRDRLRALFFRDAVLRDIDEEMRAHLELATEANIRRGMTPDEARRAARRGFGDPAAIRDSAYDVRGGGMLEKLWQDLRFGTRVLRRSPGVTLSALLTWALGIGATIAVFSVVKPLLLDPLPFADPDRLVFLKEKAPPKFPEFSISPGNFMAWREESKAFEGLAAWQNRSFVLTGGGEPERLAGQRVTDGFFKVFGVKPLLGRVFLPEEDKEGHEQVVVISHGFWQRRFGGDPSILGRALTLDGSSFTVVGVLPPDLHASVGTGDVWVPAALNAKDRANHGSHSFRAIGRLAPGVTLAQARTSLDDIERRIAEIDPNNKGWSSKPDLLADSLVANVRPSLVLLAVAVAFVLLIACANVASLLLGRAATREREIAVRTALGAGRGRILRQLATESLLLSTMGGALGLVLAMWGVDLLLALAPEGLANLKHVKLDLPILLFTLGASLVTGLLVGLAPGLSTARVDLHGALKEGGRTSTGGRGHARVRRALVVVEVASCMLLLVGAGLLVRSLGRLVAVDPGFNPDDVVLVPIDLPRSRYAEDPAQVAFAAQALEEVASLPGVRSAALSQSLPFIRDMVFGFAIVGQPPVEGQGPSANFYGVSPDYFKTMGIRLAAGRVFSRADGTDAPPVAVINDRLARTFFPSGNALGQRITFDDGKTSAEIVGVVGDVRQYGLGADAPLQIYYPFAQANFSFLTLVLKTSEDLSMLAPSIRARIQSIDPDLPVGRLRHLDEAMAASLSRQRFAVALLAVFSIVALLMVVIGVYGVISDAVTQRTHEIGVRLALGAQRGAVLRLMMRQGLVPALAGALLGLGGAFATTHFLSSLLYGVGANDAVTMALAAVVVLAVALLASYLPARRATRVEPMQALRVE